MSTTETATTASHGFILPHHLAVICLLFSQSPWMLQKEVAISIPDVVTFRPVVAE
jgi:hypothetical protein